MERDLLEGVMFMADSERDEMVTAYSNSKPFWVQNPGRPPCLACLRVRTHSCLLQTRVQISGLSIEWKYALNLLIK